MTLSMVVKVTFCERFGDQKVTVLNYLNCDYGLNLLLYIYIIYIYGYWVVSGPHGTAFINCTCMFEGSYVYLPSTHIYQRHS